MLSRIMIKLLMQPIKLRGINFLSTNNWHIGNPNRQVQWKDRDETTQSIRIVWYNLLMV